ncbi:MAG: von Willebrand factor type A domain-containing protein [Chloroflexi bacterium]|nr:von Willebrand factor type A domain-containing protein [Chloroflexota bacterium]
MNRNNDMNERELERLLEEHFSSGAANAPPTPDLWGQLESRLGAQDPKPLWAVLRDVGTPVDGFRFAPALAATAAVAVVAVAGGSVWFAVGTSGDGGVLGMAEVEPAAAPVFGTPTPEATMADAPGPAAAQALEEQEEQEEQDGALGAPGVPGAPEADGPDRSGRPTPEAMMEAMPAPTPTPAPVMQERAQTSTAVPAPPTATPGPQSMVEGVAGLPEQRSTDRPGATTFQDYERQRLTQASEDNVSTFSLDTDRTSFQLALNWARAGYRVDPASVRAEEWVNAFDYGYAAPAASDRFAITSDLIAHPLESGRYMARVAFQAPDVVEDRPLNVTLVLDASGSMSEGNRVAIAREAADAIRRSLDADDRISVVHFSTDVLHEYTVQYAAPDHRAVIDSIRQLSPHNSTNVQMGLDLGVQYADTMRRERLEALNYVILMSDGVANVDATDPFAILEATSAPDGADPLRLVTVGVGIANYNDHLLEQLAQHGNGWYRYLFDEEQARETFRRDNWLALASPVADQTRAQVTWDPDAVKAWRIVGYENRITSAESFTQDRKEFAEVYSGAATTVFYELELHDDFRQQGALGQVELRWVAPESGRGWSQTTDVVGNGRVVSEYADPLLGFGAVVALTADRYSTLDGSGDPYAASRDLRSLQGLVDGLQNELGHLAAFRDFAYVLESLVRSVPPPPANDSGYSR